MLNMDYTIEIDDKDIIQCNECYMVGVLADKEESYPNIGDEQDCVTPMRNSSTIVFYIKPLSQDPEPIADNLNTSFENPLYIGIDNDQSSYTINTMQYKHTTDIELKKSMIKDKLKDKVILFKPKLASKHDSNRIYKNAIIVVIEPDIKIDKDTIFTPVPVVEMPMQDFESKLLKGQYIMLEGYNHATYPPEYILCGDYLYFEFPLWEKHDKNIYMWKIGECPEKIKKTRINFNSLELSDKMIRGGSNSLIFIEQSFLYKNSIENKDVGYITTHPAPEVVDISIPKVKQDIGLEDECAFLYALKNFALKQRLSYSMDDLINFHTCIKTNLLTILAGMSGTGKTQLALIYAKLLGLDEENGNLLFLPISPSYTEPGDLLGYLNNMNGLFMPSETGLADFLIHAQENPKEMHIAIFDEMNLSQVEYWFAPFISLMEKQAYERNLLLYNVNSNCINKSQYPSMVNIGDNIRFIGTVNMDETTKNFSDRLLDRANVITLKKKNFKELKSDLNEVDQDMDVDKVAAFDSYLKYSPWIQKDKLWLDAYTEEELEFLDELHAIINSCDAQKGISFRIARKMGEYLNNIPRGEDIKPMLSKEDAFDMQIKQRLITKLRGTEGQLGKLVGISRKDEDLPEDGILFDFFTSDRAQEISHFYQTRQEIIRKARELGRYGYAD